MLLLHVQYRCYTFCFCCAAADDSNAAPATSTAPPVVRVPTYFFSENRTYISNSENVRSRWFVQFASSTVYQMTRYAACAVLSIAYLPCVFRMYAPSIADWTSAGIEAVRLITYQLLVGIVYQLGIYQHCLPGTVYQVAAYQVPGIVCWHLPAYEHQNCLVLGNIATRSYASWRWSWPRHHLIT